MKAFIVALIALVVIAGGGYAIMHKSSNKSVLATTNQSHNAGSASSQKSPNTITFDGAKFSPASITVKSGTTVTITNTSAQDLQMDSNPHPVHTDDTDLNVGLVSAGQSQTFTVAKTGTYGFHDHLDPGIQGKITIQ